MIGVKKKFIYTNIINMKKILLLLLLPFTLLAQKPLAVIVTTDAYPTETYWILMKDSLYGDTIAVFQLDIIRHLTLHI